MDTRRWRSAWLVLAPIALVPLVLAAGGRATSAQTPQQPLSIVGHIGGAPRDVVIQGGYAYVATGYSLDVLDLSTPNETVRVGALPRVGAFTRGGSDDAQRLHVDGDRLVIADRHRARIVDVSDPTAPRELGSFSLPQTAIVDAVPNGDYLYVSGHGSTAGVTVVDISDPANTTEIRHTDDGSYIWLVLAGDYLLAFGYESDSGLGPGLRVYDVSQPDAPFLVATHTDVVADPYDLDLDGEYLYVGANDSLRIYDIAQLPQVQEVGRLSTTEPVEAVCAQAGRAFIVYGDYLATVDVTDPTAPVSPARLNVTIQWRLRGVSRVDVSGDTVVMALVGRSTYVVDVSGGSTPRILRRLNTDVCGISTRVAAADGFAYVADRGLITTVDCTDPAHPNPIHYIDTGLAGYPLADIAAQGPYLYVLLEETEPARQSLRIHDRDAGLIGGLDVDEGSSSGSLVVRGGLAYISGQSNDAATGEPTRHLHVVDVSDPLSPRLLADLELRGLSFVALGHPDLAVLDRYVLLAMHKGFEVVDVSDPAHPVAVGQLDLGHVAYALSGFADTAFLAYRLSSGLGPVLVGAASVADAVHPALTVSATPYWTPLALGLSAQHLFTGAYEGVEMFATVPSGTLRWSGHVSLPARAHDVALDGGYAYVAGDDAGLFILYTGDDDLPDAVPPTSVPPTPATATSSPPATATPTSTPTATPTSTSIVTPVPTATAGATAMPTSIASCVCPTIRRRVPPVVISYALANPGRIYGWQLPLNPGKPMGPDNPVRACLALRNANTPYHPLWNSVVWRVGCQ